MSIERVYEFTCDICHHWEIYNRHSKEYAKVTARKHGWTLGAKHRCPDCVKKRKAIRT